MWLLASPLYNTVLEDNILFLITKVKVKVAHLYLTLCDPMGYKVHGILQARILEWVAFPFSRDLPNPGLELRTPTCRRILYQLSHKGCPRILQWVLCA